MTGIERHWKEVAEQEREQRRKQLAKLREEHGWAIALIGQLEAEFNPHPYLGLMNVAGNAGLAGLGAMPGKVIPYDYPVSKGVLDSMFGWL